MSVCVCGDVLWPAGGGALSVYRQRKRLREPAANQRAESWSHDVHSRACDVTAFLSSFNFNSLKFSVSVSETDVCLSGIKIIKTLQEG